MTSIEHIKNANNNSLFSFLNGHRASAYVVPEEKGFQTTGNIGSLLNSSPCYLNKITDGILLNNRNLNMIDSFGVPSTTSVSLLSNGFYFIASESFV